MAKRRGRSRSTNRGGSRSRSPRTKHKSKSPAQKRYDASSDETTATSTSSMDLDDNYSSDHTSDKIDSFTQPSDQPPQPTTGFCCEKHGPILNEIGDHPYAHLRTLYSHFPRNNTRLFFLHLIFTGLIYIIIFPIVNFAWTYFTNVDDQIVNLFTYISDEPSYNPGSIRGHIKRLRWLSFPSINAECIALLFAIILKDAVTIHWEELLEKTSLTNIIVDKVANRYNR